MGSTDSRAEDNEKNVHTVKLSSFLICDHEVTRGEYKKYCKWSTSNDTEATGSDDDRAVGWVSYNDAIVYCNLRSVAEGLTPCYSWAGEKDVTKWSGIQSEPTEAGTVYCGPAVMDDSTVTETYNEWSKNIVCDFSANGYRLPTESEWECAARGGITQTDIEVYPGTTETGEDYANLAVYMKQFADTSVPKDGSKVKTLLPNGYGLYDMAGNVWEWCWDWYEKDYPVDEQTDPTGPASFTENVNRVYRGGSVYFIAKNENYFRVSYRGCYAIDKLKYGIIGIRLVRSVR